ncbi:hypothetical protein EDC04DRAFT_2603254 [Pisolithus marmoratus]|nr:hypothetical protein EDC04DRAFT_2603254 [Pisolithus marmoratus]
MAVTYGYNIALQDGPFVSKEQSSTFIIIWSDSLDSIVTIACDFEGIPSVFWRNRTPVFLLFQTPYPITLGPRSGSPHACYPKAALVLAPRIPHVPAIQRWLSFWLPTSPACLLSKGGSRSGALHSLCACYLQLALVFDAPHSLYAHYPPQPAPGACAYSPATYFIWWTLLQPAACPGAGVYSPGSRVA